MDKIAFKLDTPEAVEYANAHSEFYRDYGNQSKNPYPHFHIPSFEDGCHTVHGVMEGYTDVSADFIEKIYRPWKEGIEKEAKERAAHTMTLKDVGASDNAPSISGCDAPVDSGNTDDRAVLLSWAFRNYELELDNGAWWLKDSDGNLVSFEGVLTIYDNLEPTNP